MKPFSVVAGVAAGALGGLAEIAWVGLYNTAVSGSGLEVARQITVTALPAAGGLDSAPAIGVGIHMLLSIALGLALAKLLLGRVPARYGRSALVPAALAALAVVWAINFLVVLPAVNPAFVTLLPLAVTLASKLLFGAAMGWTLQRVIA